MVEVMMGFTVASALLASIAPLLLLAVSTRLHNYRAEQAMEIAQGHIHRIQALMTQGIDPEFEQGLLPPEATGAVSQVDGPRSTETNPKNVDSPDEAIELDYDNDGKPEFLVQLFRDRGVRFNDGVAQGQLAVFRIGVRVYSGMAKDNLGNLSTEVVHLNLTESYGNQQTQPMAVFYTEVSRSDLRMSLQEYREYLTP